MMGMKQPEPLPETEAHTQFWGNFKKFILFTFTTVAVSTAVKVIESQAGEIILSSI